MEENFSPVSPEIYEEKQTKEEKPIKTAADRLRETVNMPDFGIPEIQTNDEIFKEAPTPLPLDIAHKLVDGAKIREGIGEQTAVAIENALTGIGAFGDQATLAFGQVTSAVTGNTIAEDFMDTAVKNLEMRMEDMKYAEDSVGGIRNLIAQLAGGTVSMGELLLVSAATGGMGGYVQMGVQAFGEGAFNDMEKYKEEHGGSLKGYQPKNLDIAINAGNAFLQAVIEKKFGVSSPRFLTGLSRGLVAEGASGFLQESTQSALADLAEYAKGNKEVEGWLDDAEGWIRDGIVGAILQGSLGAATYNYAHNNAIKFYAKARAQAQGRETPNNEDTTFGKNIVNAKERGYASALTQEFKAAFDASTGEGQLRDKIAFALKKAVDAKDLDLDVANEEELGPRIMQIATQETLNAMDYAREQNRAISDMELNNIVYKDGAIWLEGLTPEVGDKAVSYARVLAERQSGLAELQTRIDANTRELQQLKADLAEAKAQKQESRAQVLQARIDKQNAIAEKNRMQAQKLEAQTAKLEKQIAKQTEQVKVAEPVKTEEVSAEEVKPVEAPVAEKPAVKEPVKMAEVKTKKTKPVTERKSLKQERETKETDKKLSEVYNRVMKQAKEIAETQLAEIPQAEKQQAKKTTYPDKGESFFKKEGDVYIEIIPQIDDITKTYLVKYHTYKRNMDTDRISNIYGKSVGEFMQGSTEWGQIEYAKNKEQLEKIVNKMIKDFGEDYAYFNMELTDDSLKYLAEGHQQEKPEALNYKNQELRDLEQQGFEEQYKIKTGKDWKEVKTQATPQVDEASLEQYDPRKQYNKYDMVRVRTQSGEHIGVWDGERMTLHETMEDAQDFIKNDTEREEADRQADERRATAQKEESEKQEKAFREGQGFVEMPYIIQLLKDNDMWEGLSLREKGNFNAIGSVMFSNGRIVNAFGNENSKKGTKVTQNTLDTIQKLRDKLNQSKSDKSLDFSEVTTTNKKETLTREQVIENMTNGSDRFLKIIIPTEGNSFIAANKETLDKIDMFAQADFLQRAVANDKTTPDMIGEIFDFIENMPQGNYLSNVYYDIMVKPTTPTDVALKAKDKYNRAMVDSTTQEDWAGKTPSEIATEKIKTVFGVFQSEIKKYEKKGVITDTDAEEKDADFAQIGSELLDKELLEYIFMKYNFDPRVIEWIRDNPNLLQNNEEQEDAWETGSGSNLVDILGEPLGYAPDGLKQIDIYDEKEPEFDYETTVYKMPQTQEEFENKIVSAMYKQTAKGLDLQETELQDATPNDDRTPYLFQGSISGKGDTARGGYDEQLKRIILGEKSDLSTIQHEFAHYWIQNNFKWARSGLASQDWLRRWRDVEEWLGIEPQDRLLSKSASEKFAKAYERYILEGKVAPELQWAFEGFQKAYQDIYDDLENEYFDLDEELAPEVVDWFNRNKEQSPKRLLQADEKKLEKALTLAAGGSVIEEAPENTIVMTEQNKEGDPVVYMGVKQSEIPAGDNLLVQADKTTASKLQQSAKRWLSDKVEVQQLTTLDTQATLKNFKDWIARDRQGAWNAMMNPDTRPIYRTYLYKAFAEQAMNDVNLAMELANVDMAESVRELGQAIQALDIRNESGFDMIEIIRNLEKSKGKLSEEELNNSIAESGVFDVELSEEEMNEIDSETECKL